ncbi:MAG: ABC transporter permease subunit [Anaerolineaceae bacterium]|nr:ABC transporter permease subunit [Anaerolineaceae bacterium]
MDSARDLSQQTQAQQPSTPLQKLSYKLGIGVWRADQQFEGYLFLLPSLIGFVIFVLIPIVVSLALSFHQWDLITPPKYIGTANYIELFTKDPIFGSVLKNTFWYTVLIVPVQIVLGFILAVILNMGLRWAKFYRMLYFMPVVASVVAAAMVFRFLFNQNGVITASIWELKGSLLGQPWIQSSPQLLEWVNSINPPDFLNAPGQGIFPGWALVSVAIFTVWKNVGFTMVIYMAALQAVPDVLYDAAKVDGANRRQLLRFVTIPLVSPTTFFILVIQMLGAFQIFTEPIIMSANTQRQLPAAAASIVTYIYQNAFSFTRMGKAAAISWVLFAIVFAVTILQTVLQRRWVYYETD